MFGNDKHRRADIGQFSGKTTIIAQEAELRGDVRFTGALQVDGRIVGNIETDQGLVRVSEHGHVEGIIRAPSVLVNGLVVGDVHASEHLELDTKARITGNLYYQAMEMVIGAQISGQLHYVGASEKVIRHTSVADAESG